MSHTYFSTRAQIVCEPPIYLKPKKRYNHAIMTSYSIPPDYRVYAIGDIHGHLATLSHLHKMISGDLLKNEPPKNVHIVYIGDYVDRGPDSKGVLDFLIERQSRGDGIGKSFLLGNHEQGMLDFISNDDPINAATWLQWGGMETLASYGHHYPEGLLTPTQIESAQARFAQEVPQEHIEFLQALEPIVQLGDYVFAHAGVNPLRAMEEQELADLTFMREPFLGWHQNPQYRPLPKRVVHGHTISEEPEVLPHRIGIDTGLWSGGKLTAVVLEGADVRFLQTPEVKS